MLKLNLLTIKKGESAEEPISVTEREFWEYYLKLLNVQRKISLTNKELNVMSYLLSKDPNKSYFKGAEARELREALRISNVALSKIKGTLVLKKYIEETGVTRGDALPAKNLRAFQLFVKQAIAKGTLPPINVMFSFKIEEDETSNKESRKYNYSGFA